jgi:hypothetical protein
MLISSTGAGVAISEGKKIRALVATKAIKKTKKMIKGAIYWRKIVICLVSW